MSCVVSISGTRVGTWRLGKEVICVSVRRWEGEMRPSLLAAPKCRPPSSLSFSFLSPFTVILPEEERWRWIECETESRKGALSRLKVRASERPSVCVGSPFSPSRNRTPFGAIKTSPRSATHSLGSLSPIRSSATSRERRMERRSEGERDEMKLEMLLLLLCAKRQTDADARNFYGFNPPEARRAS